MRCEQPLETVSETIRSDLLPKIEADRLAMFPKARDWYFAGRRIFGQELAVHRIDIAAWTIRLLLRMLPDEMNCERISSWQNGNCLT